MLCDVYFFEKNASPAESRALSVNCLDTVKATERLPQSGVLSVAFA